MKVNLPCIIKVSDYHEFRSLQEQFRQIIPGIKVFEVGFTNAHLYEGVAYVGRKDDKKVRHLVKEINEDILQ